MTRVMLSHVDFNRLVRGDVIEQNGVEIALSDIGFPAMRAAIAAAVKQARRESYTTPRGVCPGCGKDIALTKDGTLRSHGGGGMGYSAAPECEGSRMKPGGF